MKKRWFEIFQFILCFFWIPSFWEGNLASLSDELVLALIGWFFLNALCGAYYIWAGMMIVAIGLHAMYKIIKLEGRYKFVRIMLQLGFVAFNLFGLYYAYELSELWRYI